MATTTLYSRGWLGSKRVMIEENCLGFYEHQFGNDRVKRVLFDRMESVVVWRRFPWDRAAVFTILFGLPGLCMTIPGLVMDEPGMWVIGGGMLLFWAIVFGRHVMFGRSTILARRDGKTKQIRVIASPKRITDFLDTLDEAVMSYQYTHGKSEPPAPPESLASTESLVPPESPAASAAPASPTVSETPDHPEPPALPEQQTP